MLLQHLASLVKVVHIHTDNGNVLWAKDYDCLYLTYPSERDQQVNDIFIDWAFDGSKKVNYIGLALGGTITARFCLVYYIDTGISNPKYAALTHLICCVLICAVLLLYTIDRLDFIRK